MWSDLGEYVCISELKGWCRARDREEILYTMSNFKQFSEMTDDEIMRAPLKFVAFRVPTDPVALDYYTLRMRDREEELRTAAKQAREAPASQGGAAKRPCVDEDVVFLGVNL
jgi:hypothetical protein